MTCNTFCKTIRNTYNTYVSPHPTRCAQQTADRRVFKNPHNHNLVKNDTSRGVIAQKKGVPRSYDCRGMIAEWMGRTGRSKMAKSLDSNTFRTERTAAITLVNKAVKLR